MSGSAPRSSAVAPREVLGEGGQLAQEGALDLERRDRRVHRRRLLLDELLERLGVAPDGLPGVGHGREQARVGLGDRGDHPRGVAELLEEARKVGAGGGEVARDRLEVAEQARRLLDRAPDGGAAAGERVAKALQVQLARAACLRVEHLEDLVEVDVGPGPLERNGVAVLERGLRAALGQLEVLEAERRTRADPPPRVLGDVADRLVELERELGADAALGELHRLHVADHADAEAAGADLVALDQVLAVGEAHLQRRGGHERQPVVRVVGEEDRDDHHEHGHRAHEHGVGEHGDSRSGPWWFGLSR